jgi:hypothetical protein
LQGSVSVGIVFIEWNGINRAFFDRFAVSSVEEALVNLTICDDVFLLYHFYVEGLYPAFKWDADWPLWGDSLNSAKASLVLPTPLEAARSMAWSEDDSFHSKYTHSRTRNV